MSRHFTPRQTKPSVNTAFGMPRHLSDRLWQMVMDVRKKKKIRITKAEMLRQMITHCIEEYYADKDPAANEKE